VNPRGSDAGLYVHLPFCLSKCRYCDFVSYAIGRHRSILPSYLEALRREAAARADELAGRRVVGVYFGGGTPTTLAPGDLAALLRDLGRVFDLAPGAEVTIEANPGTVDPAGLAILRAAGFNRLSLGAQAFQDDLLKRLGRVHDTVEIGRAVADARRAGFDRVNLDLIFGLPGQTVADWRDSLDRAVDLDPEHVAAYGLKVEPGTPFGADLAAGQLDLPGEDLEAAMYEEGRTALGAAGFIHYEISNWAKPGGQSRHNLLYWRNQDYLGLGVAAWSHHGRTRRGNVTGLEDYVGRVTAGLDPLAESEELDPRRAAGEAAFLALRTLDGLDLEAFTAEQGGGLADLFPGAVDRVTATGLAIVEGGRLHLTSRGLLLANQVFQEFVD
jgi:oxygen-independent coproporphyrinogen-3 oxidase